MNFFIVSDIHGMYKHFEQILTYWDKESTLVVLGDLIDRGEQSYEVVRKVMELQKQYGDQVIYLKGNHEDLFLKFIENPTIEYGIYFRNGGLKTLKSFIQDFEVKELSKHMHTLKTKYAEEIEFIKSGLSYYQVGKLLLTHAGFESRLDNWLDTSPGEYIWIRDHYQYPNKTNLINIFGHTPTYHIHGVDDIWVSPCHTYIGIDGACAYGGQLNALLITKEGKILEKYVVDNGAAKRKAQIETFDFFVSNRTFEGILLSVQKTLNLSDAEIITRLGMSERRFELLSNKKVHPDREEYKIVYDTFFDSLSADQKSYLSEYIKEPDVKLSYEDLMELLKGESIDFE